MQRHVYFLSDGTGITAESLGKSLLTQFEGFDFEFITLPFINSEEKARACVTRIQHVMQQGQQPPLIFLTIVDPALASIIHQTDAVVIDVFATFIKPLENALAARSSHRVGLSHAQNDFEQYHQRINAINFAQANDDGCSLKNYDKADVIVLGVSRSGKTPTCLYLALNYGLKAANYPVTDEDMPCRQLPEALQPFQQKLFGLSIQPEHLQMIRSGRRSASQYASRQQCYYEVEQVVRLYQQAHIPYLDTTNLSIEEIAARIKAWHAAFE